MDIVEQYAKPKAFYDAQNFPLGFPRKHSNTSPDSLCTWHETKATEKWLYVPGNYGDRGIVAWPGVFGRNFDLVSE